MKAIDIDSVIRIPVTKDTLYYTWLWYTKPIHGLTATEITIASCLLKHRDKLKAIIHDQSILDRELLGNTIRDEIIKETGVTLKHYRMIMTNLRKHKFIVDGCINAKYIPDVKENKNDFRVLLKFDIDRK